MYFTKHQMKGIQCLE